MINIVKRWFVLQTKIEGFRFDVSPFIYELLKRKYELIINSGTAIRVCNKIVVYIDNPIDEIENMNLGGDSTEIVISLKDIQSVLVNYAGELVDKKQLESKIGSKKLNKYWKELKVKSIDALLWNVKKC